MSKIDALIHKLRLDKTRRTLFEALGSDRYSRPSLNDLDRKLEKYLPQRGGFFVELGANDGFTQSNTYYFEKLRGWRGILIEPIPQLYAQVVRNRPRSRVFNCACVPFDFEGPSVTMTYANLMSVVKGGIGDLELESQHIDAAEQVQQLQAYEVTVPTRTLTSILEGCGVTRIDLLSLDVEGFESDVLRGLDLDRFHPQYILIELKYRQNETEALLAEKYRKIDQLSPHDFLYIYK